MNFTMSIPLSMLASGLKVGRVKVVRMKSRLSCCCECNDTNPGGSVNMVVRHNRRGEWSGMKYCDRHLPERFVTPEATRGRKAWAKLVALAIRRSRRVVR